jgi:hypothetical protein
MDIERDERRPSGFGEACAAIARAAAESRGVGEVMARIASAVRLVVPFEAIGLWHAPLSARR